MLTVYFGDNNYLGINYESEFMYKGFKFNTINDALQSGVCNSLIDFKNMLIERCLQNSVILKHLILLEGNFVYFTKEHKYISIDNKQYDLQTIASLYQDIKDLITLSGAVHYCDQFGFHSVKVSNIVTYPSILEEDKQELLRIRKVLLHSFKRKEKVPMDLAFFTYDMGLEEIPW